jgi:hypothetical protein
MDTKKCSKCGEEKSLSEFYKKKRGKLGVAGSCKSCMKADNKARYESGGKERWSKTRNDWRVANPVKCSESQRKYRSKNKDKVALSHKRWAQANPDKRSASAAKRHSAKLQRRPSWANEQLIDAFYIEAKRLEELTGIKFHVDHIIPMQGELVSGLDVETNLQLLPAHENQAKHNSFDPMTFCA